MSVQDVRAPAARVFFALWPDDAVRSRLHAAGRSLHLALGGRLTRAPSIHMTLVFIGELPQSRLPLLAQHAAQVAVDAFALRVDVASCWRHNRIGWVGPRLTPAPLVDLVGRVRAAVEGAGVGFDRKPFAAHVTLLRNARCNGSESEIEPIDWPVHDFVLVRSALDAGGSAYEVIGRWPQGAE